MAEYALPAMLVGLVALGGFAALMNGNFAQTGALGLFQSTQTTQDAQGRTQLLARQFGENPTLRALSYVTEKGNRITLPAFPVDLSAVVEVDGVDGATDKLLSSLENWIDQLVASGELTEAEAAPLRELANQGHNLGGSVAQVEQALQNCGADKACVNTKIHQPGSPLYMAVNNSYVATAKNAQGVAGFEIPKAQDWEALEALMPGLRDIVLNGPSFEQRLEGVALSGGLYAFLQKYQAASQAVSGSPINQEILRVLSSSVWNLSHATSSVAFRTGQLVYREGVDLPESSPYVQQRPDQLHELVALEMVRTSGQMTDLQNSLKVHQSAGGICQMGQGQDSGTQCH